MSKKPFFAHEVIQSSAMDCGPASLKSMLAGFGIATSYERLREACQTDVDGTSIDTIEDIVIRLGVPAAQQMLPADAFLDATSPDLPCLVTVRLPGLGLHFVVLWGVVGDWVQIMDPGTGRRWVRRAQFEQGAHLHRIRLPCLDWLALVAEGPFLPWLVKRLEAVGVDDARAMLDRAVAEGDWRTVVAADAAARVVHAAFPRGRKTRAARRREVFDRTLVAARRSTESTRVSLPVRFWFAHFDGLNEDGEECLLMQGVVLLHASRAAGAAADTRPGYAPAGPASPELVAALNEAPLAPVRELFALLRRDGALSAATLGTALVLNTLGVVTEVILFRASISLVPQLGLSQQRLTGIAILFAFLTSLLVLEASVGVLTRRMGRLLELRLRVASLEKIPRLVDSYFRSRQVSDMAQRNQGVHQVRDIPALAQGLVRACLEIVVTVVAIALLDPRLTLFAAGGALLSLVVPLAMTAAVKERDLRLQTHASALTRVYLDTLLGLIPVRTHGGQAAFRSEHENSLVGYLDAGFSRQRMLVVITALQSVVAYAVAVAIVFLYTSGAADGQGLLLLIFWALRLPTLGQSVVASTRAYPSLYNTILRLLDPLRGAERDIPEGSVMPSNVDSGVDLQLENATVVAGGSTLVEEITCHVRAGEHVAIIGRSGAGKSSLVGLLLGWHRLAAGSCHVDGQALSPALLDELRARTAWVDTSVQLWNRSLESNVRFGSEEAGRVGVTQALSQADLLEVLERLPQGLQTPLGESGSLVSGGEGQRVRLARALYRPDARLVILDEPFRGLDRGRRRDLLLRARRLWANATLLCITHDVAETLAFERVMVIHKGRLTEDGSPRDLIRTGPRFRALFDADRRSGKGIWSAGGWRRVTVLDGVVTGGPDNEGT